MELTLKITSIEEAGIVISMLQKYVESEVVKPKKNVPLLRELAFVERTLNCLKSEEINTTEKLLTYRENDLLRIQNLGRKSLNEIKEALALHGLQLKE